MLRILGIVSFIVWIIPGFSFAATYHVARTGSDGVTCANADFAPDSTQAKLTIQAGVNCATQPGDIVIVHVGTYVETVTSWPASGASGNPIIIRANTGETVTWRGSGTDVSDVSTGAIYIIDRNYIRIQGFRFDSNVTAATVRVLHSATTNKTTSPTVGIEIVNNTFVNNGNNGSTAARMSRQIYLQYIGREATYTGATLNRISGNTFTNNFGANIDFDNSSDILVENNTSTGNKGSREPSTGNQYQTNLIQYGGSNLARRLIIQNNTFGNVIKDTYIGAAVVEASGIRCDVDPVDITIRNNVIHDLGNEAAWDGTRHFFGVYIEWGCNTHLIYNNVIYNVNENGIRVGGNTADNKPTDGSQIYNNTLWNTGRAGIYLDRAKNTTVANNVFSGSTNAQVIVSPNSISNGGNTFSNNLWRKDGTSLFARWNFDPNVSGYQAGNLDLAGWVAASGETNAVSSDPLFTNSSSRDFTLSSASPAKDAGKTISLVTADIIGTVRPQGAAYDIGAYEFSGPPLAAPSNVIVK
jgi:parallel beta-helix repeat protein